MKKIIFIISIIAMFLSFSGFAYNNQESDNYYYTTTVEHLFTHCLIAYPEIAFKKDNPMRENYNIDCITKDEFIKILNSLYENNYALVDINETFINNNGKIEKKKIKVPKGKKPLILSFDDVNYDHKKMGLGMVDKIILDSNGNLASSTKVNNKEEISYSNEFVPILENFIKKHPSFSIRGAKGTLNLTGYDGILGYRTQSKNKINRQQEIESVMPVIEKLKSNGWNFACHSFGHYHMNKLTYEEFCNELNLWKNEVEPLIGQTKIYVYPYGEWEIYKNGIKSDKHKLLENHGFELFCGVGMKTFFSYLPTKSPDKVLFMDRKVIDGTTLRKRDVNLYPFFNPSNVYDYKFRPSA